MRLEEGQPENMKEHTSEASPASLVPGLNDNVEFMGRQLHVQTEYAGFPAAHVITQIFCRGRVVLTRKSGCQPGISDSGTSDKIRELMHSQHCRIIQEIRNKQSQIQNAH
jgi:hypothetical protein